jgi:hypothetical protein
MCGPYHLLPDDPLCGLRVSCQLVKLLLSGVSLGYFELPLDLTLHSVLELGLYLLRLPEHVPELTRERAMHSFLHPRLRLILVCLLRFLNITCHILQQLLHLLLVFIIDLHYLIDLLSSHYE